MKNHGDASSKLLELLGGLLLEKIKGMKEPVILDGEESSNKTRTSRQARLEESEHPFPAGSMNEESQVPRLTEMPDITINIEKMHIPIFNGKNFSTWADKFEMRVHICRSS